ncbi:MAG: B12-binding domain-containing radical SAM protein [Eubacteriales bacterium]|nr:B12-binding domain-containing radical SAM protein [Bacillota bacterium]
MDLVLINPSYFSPDEYKARFDCFLDVIEMGNMYVYPFEPPLGLASIKAVLDRNYKVEVIDQQGLAMSNNELIAQLRAIQPKIIGITSMTSTFPMARRLAGIIKQEFPDILLIAGGVHPTVCPQETLLASTIDVVFRGEAEQTIAAFLSAYPEGDWKSIPGIGFVELGQMVLNEMPPVIRNLDDLPIPDYNSFPTLNYMEYNSHLRHIKGISMLVSRGCPYECTFCAVKATMGRGWRAKSPERVVKEIDFLYREFGIEGIWFKDSIFNMNKEWFKEYCNLLLEAKLPVTWQFNTRVDLIDEESLAHAKKAGLTQIDLGIESGSPLTLDRLKKKTTLEHIVSGVNKAKKHVLVSGFFMIGTPGETIEDINMTFELAKSLQLDRCSWSIYNPLPGSDLYNELASSGRLANQRVCEEVHFTQVPESFCEIPTEELNTKYQEINSYFSQQNR